jgi:hypothetical protein
MHFNTFENCCEPLHKVFLCAEYDMYWHIFASLIQTRERFRGSIHIISVHGLSPKLCVVFEKIIKVSRIPLLGPENTRGSLHHKVSLDV